MTGTTVSPPSTLWATASKEWVIPAKPKPGRKPKKDPTQTMSELSENDAKGRRVQNRAAQRAFRERKQSQLAELQARVQQYEQGEVERNIALQNIAKRLKEENEKLRAENIALKEKLGGSDESSTSQDGSRKRTRGDSGSRSPNFAIAHLSRKKSKLTPDPPNIFIPSERRASYDPSSPSSSTSSPRSHTSSHTSFSPLPTLSASHEAQAGNSLNSMFDISVNETKSALFEGGPLSCGFCSETSSCVCKEITMQQVSDQLSLSDSTSQLMKDHEYETPATQFHLQASPSTKNRYSILENLPAYQAAVPLRRRRQISPLPPIFPTSENPTRAVGASCSGDPSNCLACVDDAFGKAFCDAISRSVAMKSQSSCGYCPEPSQVPSNSQSLGCCGNPVACGSMVCGPPTVDAPPTSPHVPNVSTTMSDPPSSSDTISCDNAWRQLKSHPNVAFSDLTLLAEVVARRSKCSGPRVEIYAAPGSVNPERTLSPGKSDPSQQAHERLLSSELPSQFDQSGSSLNAPSPPPQLVPQEVLISCGRQRVREVMTDGVHDALRLLDAKFPISGRLSNYCN
ncbi:uncharacterized protein FIBRA_00997 [Fibroporia radiculosa]|uniref:BZIP domain-containing protein n=1 Tax=Fibroporia radiculosa TaxID=599839 RepID=J4H0V1_9APHY|nr:uncharacterized protein FIBRA_00997 [Fibroporia radiculosa]CCL98989.1 predicted protein [Fibroporia radiculosa]